MIDLLEDESDLEGEIAEDEIEDIDDDDLEVSTPIPKACACAHWFPVA